MIKARYFRYFDITTSLILLALMATGLIFIFSATYTPTQPFSLFFKKELLGACIGLILYCACLFIDARTLMRIGYFCYLIVIGLLFITLIKGVIGMGAQRWIDLFFFRIQPSELVKLSFPAFFAYSLHTAENNESIDTNNMPTLLCMLAISIFLIAKQPDLATALLILFSGLVLCWFANISKKFWIYGLLSILIILPISTSLLHDYQKKRITTFLGLSENKKDRYQIEQATIAIGSGEFLGKGLCKGTQNKLRFLPESRTDFIFAVLAEEIGFLGSLLIILLYVALFYRCFSIIAQLNQPILQLFATGLIIHVVFATIINLCMVLRLLPTAGIPLPFMSYGMSNLLVNCISFGIFQRIAMHRLLRRTVR